MKNNPSDQIGYYPLTHFMWWRRESEMRNDLKQFAWREIDHQTNYKKLAASHELHPQGLRKRNTKLRMILRWKIQTRLR